MKNSKYIWRAERRGCSDELFCINAKKFDPLLHQIKKGITVRCAFFYLVETTGIEPVTPCMSSKYSNQLSYASTEPYHFTIRGLNCQPPY